MKTTGSLIHSRKLVYVSNCKSDFKGFAEKSRLFMKKKKKKKNRKNKELKRKET